MLSFRFGGGRKKIKELAGLVLSGDFEEETIPSFSPGFWWSVDPWHFCGLSSSCSHCLLLCVSVGLFQLFRVTLPLDLGPTLTQQVDHCHPYFNYFSIVFPDQPHSGLWVDRNWGRGQGDYSTYYTRGAFWRQRPLYSPCLCDTQCMLNTCEGSGMLENTA